MNVNVSIFKSIHIYWEFDERSFINKIVTHLLCELDENNIFIGFYYSCIKHTYYFTTLSSFIYNY